MEAKLTLKLNENSISRAKEYVSSIGSSLSAVVQGFFDSLTSEKDAPGFVYGPIVSELSGLIHLEKDFDYKSNYASYLEQKYE